MRRNILKPPPAKKADDARRQKLQTRLALARAGLRRWQTRFRRAFNAIEKLQRTVDRIEKELGKP